MAAIHFRYDQASIDALLRIYDSHRHAKHAMVRGVITNDENGARKRAVPHWNPATIANEEFKWLSLPALSRSALEKHIREPGCVVGIVPAILGLVILDIDLKDPDAILRVAARYGNPVQVYPTLSGGWHAVYHGHSLEDMKRFSAGAFLVNGVHYGEVCCARRFANVWAPIVLERAANSWTIDTPKLASDAIERAPVSAPAGDSLGGRGYPLDTVIQALDLRLDGNEWQGYCPICDPEHAGGGTRFKARLLQDGSVMLNCFSCAPSGFQREQYARLMKIIRDHDAPQRKSMLSNLIGIGDQR